MHIDSLFTYPYSSVLNGEKREGAFLQLKVKHLEGWGEIAPFSERNSETLLDSLNELSQYKEKILKEEWHEKSFLKSMKKFPFLPSLSFAFESALLTLLSPLQTHTVTTSALLMGSSKEILKEALERKKEGFTSAKLKVSSLSFEEAEALIHELKNTFSLRIDVNQAWSVKDSLKFFSKFPLDTFDYVEEPFETPLDLKHFPHPLAVDESFPRDLSLSALESLPTLKALIYKPTEKGGFSHLLSLKKWCTKKGVKLVLSSTYETDIGLGLIGSLARRLSLTSPIGIGTYTSLPKKWALSPLVFQKGHVFIPPLLKPVCL